MPLTREKICDLTSRKLRAALPAVAALNATVGLDGFVDEILAVVDKRQPGGEFTAVRSIDDLAAKIKRAAGQSSNYELVVRYMKLGGNGPIMANALACLVANVTYIGSVGYPTSRPVVPEFARRAKVIGIGEPGHTDALDFDDGKLMLGKHETLQDVNWDTLVSRVGRPRLKELMDGSHLIAMVNWTMLPHMSRIWAKLLDEVIPS